MGYHTIPIAIRLYTLLIYIHTHIHKEILLTPSQVVQLDGFKGLVVVISMANRVTHDGSRW